MKLVNMTIQEIITKCQKVGSRIFCIGAGKGFRQFEQGFQMFSIGDFVAGIADNNSALWDTFLTTECGRCMEVMSIAEMQNRLCPRDIIVVTTLYLSEIMNQLEGVAQENPVVFYGFLIDNYCDTMLQNGEMDASVVYDERFFIPKVIHYCWFGRGRIPDRYRIWMESWKKYCPGYEIVEWNEDNYDITKNDYMMQAYEARRWGFVPDYARLDILYQHGGIYLDTDVEVLQPLDDLLHQEAFAGFQEFVDVALGLGFGAVPKHPLLKEMRDEYVNLSFRYSDRTLNLVPSPYYQMQTLLRHGLARNGRFQCIAGMNIYPKIFFSPMNHHDRKIRSNRNSYLLHHYDGSWIKGNHKNAWEDLPEIYARMMESDMEDSQND